MLDIFVCSVAFYIKNLQIPNYKKNNIDNLWHEYPLSLKFYLKYSSLFESKFKIDTRKLLTVKLNFKLRTKMKHNPILQDKMPKKNTIIAEIRKNPD